MENETLYYNRSFLGQRGQEHVSCGVESYQGGLDIEFNLSDGNNNVFLTTWGNNKSDNLEFIDKLKVISKALTECIETVEKYYEQEV